MKGRLLKKVLLPLLSVLILVLLLVIVLRAFFPSDVLRKLAIAKLEEATGLTISVQDAAISFVHWRIGVKVYGTSVSRAEGEELTRLATVPEIGVVVALRPLLRREIVVDQVYVERPEISIKLGQEGATGPGALAARNGGQLTRAPHAQIPARGVDAGSLAASPHGGLLAGTSGSVSLLMPFSLPKAVVREASIRVEDLRTGALVTLNRFNATSRVQFDGVREAISSEGTFLAREVSVVPPAKLSFSIPPHEVKGSWKVSFDPEARLLTLDRVSLEVSELPIEIAGSVNLGKERPDLDVELKLDKVPAGKLVDLLPHQLLEKTPDLELDGLFEVLANVRGTLASPDFNGTFAFVDGSGSVSGIKAEELRARGRFDAEALQLDQFAVSVGGSKVNGHVVVKTQEPRSATFASSGKLKLEELGRLLALPGGPRVKGGEAVFDLKGGGLIEDLRADPLSVELEGEASVSSVELEASQQTPGVSIERAHLGFSRRSVKITETSVKVGGSVFNITGRVADWRERSVELQLKSPFLDLQELFLPLSKAHAAERGEIPVVAPLPVGGFPLNGSATLKVERLKFGRFSAQGLSTRLLFGGDSLVVSELRIKAMGGRCRGKGRLLLPQTGSPAYTGSFSAENIQMAELLSSFTPLKELMRGVTFFEISVQGELGEDVPPLESVVATGQVTTRQVKAIATPLISAVSSLVGLERKDEYPLRDFTTSFLVEDGKVVLPKCRLVGKNSIWEFSGSTGFDGTLDYAVNVTLSPEYSKRIDSLRGIERLFRDEQGRVVLDLIVGGTVKKPSLKWDLTRMEQRAKQYVAKKLRDELERQKKKTKELREELRDELEEKVDELKEEATEKGKKLLEELFKKKKKGQG